MRKNYYIAASVLLVLLLVAAIYLGERRYSTLNKLLIAEANSKEKDRPSKLPDNKDNAPDNKDTPPNNTDENPESPKYEDIMGINFLITTKTMSAVAGVNVRSGPSVDYPILGSLLINQEITVTAIGDNNWVRILFDGQTAFCSADYLQ